MLGVILGLISAAAFGANTVVTRRGMFRVSSNYVATITVFSGPIFFFIIASITGDLFRLRQIPWLAHIFLALSGVSHFALGRTWAYRAIQVIGSTRSNLVTSLHPIVTIILAILILKETVTFIMVIGIVCTLTGPLLIFLKEQVIESESEFDQNLHGRNLNKPTLYKGMLYGIGAAIFWGSSAIFIKLGLEHGGLPIAGSLVAYLTASVVIAPSALFRKEHREELWNGDKLSFKLALLSGLTVNLGQLFRYIAFGSGSAIVISMMLRTMPVWVLFFAFIFIRKYESFSRWVLLGNGLVMIGAVLVLLS
jgi:drug/metabolite transporter (DMT)-like permease